MAKTMEFHKLFNAIKNKAKSVIKETKTAVKRDHLPAQSINKLKAEVMSYKVIS